MVITVVTSNFFPEDAGIPNVKKLNLCMKSQLVVSLDSAEVHKNRETQIFLSHSNKISKT